MVCNQTRNKTSHRRSIYLCGWAAQFLDCHARRTTAESRKVANVLSRKSKICIMHALVDQELGRGVLKRVEYGKRKARVAYALQFDSNTTRGTHTLYLCGQACLNKGDKLTQLNYRHMRVGLLIVMVILPRKPHIPFNPSSKKSNRKHSQRKLINRS